MATEVDPEEDIARAICSDHYDGERYSSSLFKGQNTSVSRLAIVPLEDSWDLFRRKVEKPPDRTLEQIGTINVGSLKEIGINHEICQKVVDEVSQAGIMGFNHKHHDTHAQLTHTIQRRSLRGKFHLPQHP